MSNRVALRPIVALPCQMVSRPSFAVSVHCVAMPVFSSPCSAMSMRIVSLPCRVGSSLRCSIHSYSFAPLIPSLLLLISTHRFIEMLFHGRSVPISDPHFHVCSCRYGSPRRHSVAAPVTASPCHIRHFLARRLISSASQSYAISIRRVASHIVSMRLRFSAVLIGADLSHVQSLPRIATPCRCFSLL